VLRAFGCLFLIAKGNRKIGGIFGAIVGSVCVDVCVIRLLGRGHIFEAWKYG